VFAVVLREYILGDHLDRESCGGCRLGRREKRRAEGLLVVAVEPAAASGGERVRYAVRPAHARALVLSPDRLAGRRYLSVASDSATGQRTTLARARCGMESTGDAIGAVS